jgi:hypothetical protein
MLRRGGTDQMLRRTAAQQMLQGRPANELLCRAAAQKLCGAAAPPAERQIFGRDGDLAGTGSPALGGAHGFAVRTGSPHLAVENRGAE